jgi:NAD(P)-dependent dehydrogenase (short-subunit alcohol dehydrogenase family)
MAIAAVRSDSDVPLWHWRGNREAACGGRGVGGGQLCLEPQGTRSDRFGDQRRRGQGTGAASDLAKKAGVERLFDETVKAFGRVDILVNNAGVYEFLPLEEVTEEHFHRHFDLNVLGLVLAIQEAVRRFGPEGGSIVNIGSVAGTAPRWRPSTALLRRR